MPLSDSAQQFLQEMKHTFEDVLNKQKGIFRTVSAVKNLNYFNPNQLIS